MKKLNLYLIGIIILLLLGGWFGKQYYDGKLEKAYLENRTLKISKDELQKISDEQNRKLVADTLTQKQLNKIVDNLKLKLDAKPKIIIKTIVVPKEIEKPIDSVIVKNDSITINDYYPNKENYFVNYFAKINIKTQKGIGKFSFKPIELSLIISQRKDGIYQLDSKSPKWMKINNIQVQSLPLTSEEKDNFGWIIGGGYGKDYKTFENYFRVNSGFRWKKLYIQGGINTLGQGDINLNLEL